MSESCDMGALLDEALDELDDDIIYGNERDCRLRGDEVESCAITSQAEHDESKGNKNTADHLSTPEDVFQSMLQHFFEPDDDNMDPDENLKAFMAEMQAQLPCDSTNSPTAERQSEAPLKLPGDGVDRTMASILEEMSKANLDSECGADGNFLQGCFEGLSKSIEGGFDLESFNPDEVMDGMMEQLLSKDLMYEPMKQVTEKFPPWLEKNKGSLPVEEYERRCQQHDCFKNLVKVYETEASNVPALLDLMQQVQEHGQPPQEIINDIAPGLELDDDGMPNLNALAGAPTGGGEECVTM